MSDVLEIMGPDLSLLIDLAGTNLNYVPQVYNVKGNLYGAKGDGVKDDTAAIKAAIAAASVTGGIVWFPPGTYRCTSKITVSGSYIKFTGSEATLYLNYDQDEQLFNVTGSNIIFEDLYFKSNASYARRNAASFIFTVGASYVYITGCTMRDSPCAAIIISDASQYINVIENTVHDSKADGIHVINGSHDVIVSNNQLFNTGDDSISVVWYPSYANPPQDILIVGNLIQNSQGSGFNVSHGRDVTIRDNMVDTTVLHGLRVSFWLTRTEFAEDIVVDNNTFKNVGSSSIYHGMFLEYITRGTVKNNIIESPYQNGILIGQFNDLRFMKNIIRNVRGRGIIVIDYATLATTTKLVIDDNLIDTCVQESIYMFPNASTTLTDVTIKNNYIKNNDTGSTSSNCIVVAKTNGLNLIGNKNNGNIDKVFFDTATCTNVYASDNYPMDWTSYTPTVTAQTGAITAYTVTRSKYQVIGNVCHVNLSILITNNGTGAGAVIATLPIAAKTGSGGNGTGRESGVSGVALIGTYTTTTVTIRKYDNSYPGAANAQIEVTLAYEV